MLQGSDQLRKPCVCGRIGISTIGVHVEGACQLKEGVTRRSLFVLFNLLRELEPLGFLIGGFLGGKRDNEPFPTSCRGVMKDEDGLD
ncbi:hypothetical protein, partial [Streptomyces beigongshangae]|uniref:hypothetical protein n=1 Tax=Streptomyces beigongshangae TaxID=2841597 RepID=UPI001C8511E1